MIGRIRASWTDARICVLCDSWYPKRADPLPCWHEGLSVVANVRRDAVLHAVLALPSGKEGPLVFRRLVDVGALDLESVAGMKYWGARMTAVADIFPGRAVDVFVSTPSGPDGDRGWMVFVCTDPALLDSLSGIHLGGDAGHLMRHEPEFLPLALYSLHWNVDTAFLELKGSWGLEDYMHRSADGIENYVNLQLSPVKLLPLMDPVLPKLGEKSAGGQVYAENVFVSI